MRKSQARNEMVGIRITKDMKEKLCSLAEQKRVSLSMLIYQLLAELLSDKA